MKRLLKRPASRPKNLGGAPLGNRNAFKTGKQYASGRDHG